MKAILTASLLAVLSIGILSAQQATADAVNGTAFLDLDGDGQLSTGEGTLGGAVVRLLDENDNVIATTTAGDDGSYSFTGVGPGTYKIQIVVASGGTSRTITGAPFTKAAGQAQNVSLPVTLPQLFPNIPLRTGQSFNVIPQNPNTGNVRGNEVSAFTVDVGDTTITVGVSDS